MVPFPFSGKCNPRSVVNSNQSFLKDANTITPRDAKSSRSSMPTRVPSLEKVDEGSQNALTSTHRSQPPVQSSPAIVISAKQHSFFDDLHRKFTQNIVKPDIKKLPLPLTMYWDLFQKFRVCQLFSSLRL